MQLTNTTLHVACERMPTLCMCIVVAVIVIGLHQGSSFVKVFIQYLHSSMA